MADAGNALQQMGIAAGGVVATLAAVKVQIRYIEKRLDEHAKCIEELPEKYVPRRELSHTLRNMEQMMLDVKAYVRLMAKGYKARKPKAKETA